MEKPSTLKILSILTILFGVIRIIASIVAFTMAAKYLNSEIIAHIILEYLLSGPLILVSGILLFSGKKTGRLLLIIPVITGITINILSFGLLKTIFPLIIILALLYVIPSINEYFSKNKRIENI